jgi:hypothetical protein
VTSEFSTVKSTTFVPTPNDKHEDHDDRRQRRSPKMPERVTRIRENAFDPRKASLLTRQLCGLRESSRCHHRSPERVVRGKPAAHVLRGLHLEVARISARRSSSRWRGPRSKPTMRANVRRWLSYHVRGGEHSYGQPIRRASSVGFFAGCDGRASPASRAGARQRKRVNVPYTFRQHSVETSS